MTASTGEQYDAVVVGARCAGTPVATLLARAGRRVLLLDRDQFPSDTVSTHQLFPDSLHLLDQLGAGDRLRAAYRLRPVKYSWRVYGHAVAGGFTPQGGHDRTLSIRRIALDAELVATAVEAGAETRFGTGVAGLLGSGTGDDPARGVVLTTGECIRARWVIGADGRRSTIARRLKLPATKQLRGEMSMLFAYWEGLPDSDWCQIDVHEQLALMSAPCEDGLHLLNVAGPPELTRGSAETRQQAYLASLRRFPSVLNPRLLEQSRQVSPLVVVPETMLRGFERPATGPGWALVGDAGLFKHPVTAQGWYVGSALADGDDLAGYASWRAERAADHYEWSFDTARFSSAGAAAPIYSGLAVDPVASREFLDIFARRHRPSDVLTPGRMARWRAAWAYEQGLGELHSLLEGADDQALTTPVPACPGWSVSDLVGHIVGVAEDSSRGDFFRGAVDAWRDPALAEAREAWTASHVARHGGRSREDLLSALHHFGCALVRGLRRGDGPLGKIPIWMVAAPVGDLAVHLADLREALGLAPDTSGALTRLGFAAFRDWLHQRLVMQQLPAVELNDGKRTWQVGQGSPVGSVTTSRYELFRMISGRRSAVDIVQRYDWTTDPTPYLSILAPYPLPA